MPVCPEDACVTGVLHQVSAIRAHHLQPLCQVMRLALQRSVEYPAVHGADSIQSVVVDHILLLLTMIHTAGLLTG